MRKRGRVWARSHDCPLTSPHGPVHVGCFLLFRFFFPVYIFLVILFFLPVQTKIHALPKNEKMENLKLENTLYTCISR